MSTYILKTANTHICLQAVCYSQSTFQAGPPMLNMSPPDGDNSASCCVTMLHCVTIFPKLSLLHGHNSHLPHPATATKLARTLEWAAAVNAGRTRQGWSGVEGWWMGGGDHTRRSKEGSGGDKQRVIDVKLGKTQSLKPFNTLCGAPKACWCDLGICSQKG